MIFIGEINMEDFEINRCLLENRTYPEGSAFCDDEKCRVCKDGLWVDQGEKMVIF